MPRDLKINIFDPALSNSNLTPVQVAAEHGGDEFKTWPVRPGRWVEETHVTFNPPPLQHKMSYWSLIFILLMSVFKEASLRALTLAIQETSANSCTPAG